MAIIFVTFSSIYMALIFLLSASEIFQILKTYIRILLTMVLFMRFFFLLLLLRASYSDQSFYWFSSPTHPLSYRCDVFLITSDLYSKIFALLGDFNFAILFKFPVIFHWIFDADLFSLVESLSVIFLFHFPPIIFRTVSCK